MFLNRVALISVLAIFLLALSALVCGLALGVPELVWPFGPAATADAASQPAGEPAGALATVFASAPDQSAVAIATIQALDAPQVEALQNRLANLLPDAFGNYAITISQNEINEILNLTPVVGAPASGVQLQNLSVAFTGGNAIMTARVNQPVAADLSLTLQPVLEDGRLQLLIQNASLGPVRAPGFILSPVQILVDEALNQALANMPTNVRLHSITVGEGDISIVGREA
jgi:hypothetical protein